MANYSVKVHLTAHKGAIIGSWSNNMNSIEVFEFMRRVDHYAKKMGTIVNVQDRWFAKGCRRRTVTTRRPNGEDTNYIVWVVREYND